MTYLIHGLPRSRTYWVSKFLSYRDWYCAHDQVANLRSMDDIRSWLSIPNTGSVETAAMSFWRLVPLMKTVTIRRPVDDVIESMRQFALPIDWDVFAGIIRRLDRKLDQIEKRVPLVLRVTFDELKTEAACRELFEYCLPYPFDVNWWRAIAPINLQSHMLHTFRHYDAHRPQLEKLAKIAKHKMLTALRPVEVDYDDGLTIQQEPFAKAYSDAQNILDDHCVIIGEAPDYHRQTNLELMAKLDALGCLQVTTARCNGRMFGYLVTIISPSFESPDQTTGTNTIFYASPAFKGIGLKMQRASVEALRAKGVSKLYCYAGVRGDGPRISTLYKRLGAEDVGEWYRLEL